MGHGTSAVSRLPVLGYLTKKTALTAPERGATRGYLRARAPPSGREGRPFGPSCDARGAIIRAPTPRCLQSRHGHGKKTWTQGPAAIPKTWRSQVRSPSTKKTSGDRVLNSPSYQLHTKTEQLRRSHRHDPSRGRGVLCGVRRPRARRHLAGDPRPQRDQAILLLGAASCRGTRGGRHRRLRWRPGPRPGRRRLLLCLVGAPLVLPARRVARVAVEAQLVQVAAGAQGLVQRIERHEQAKRQEDQQGGQDVPRHAVRTDPRLQRHGERDGPAAHPPEGLGAHDALEEDDGRRQEGELEHHACQPGVCPAHPMQVPEREEQLRGVHTDHEDRRDGQWQHDGAAGRLLRARWGRRSGWPAALQWLPDGWRTHNRRRCARRRRRMFSFNGAPHAAGAVAERPQQRSAQAEHQRSEDRGEKCCRVQRLVAVVLRKKGHQELDF
mmetsp:Transcript_88964/g.251695  ORF Transcript_88964/g.251695 Transcript_88964/m.251695 type:complete len:439 (+) Transcript_88964:302-1618(+)